MIIRKCVAVLIPLVLTACASKPVGWWGSCKILSSDEEMITIQYSGTKESMADMQKIAAKHCSKYNKNESLSRTANQPFTFGMIKVYTFACQVEAA